MSAADHISDEVLLGFLDGRLGDPDRVRWLGHADECAPCRHLLAAAAPAVTPRSVSSQAADHTDLEPIARGAEVGRFVVLDLVGVGATAEVHTAYDPNLDRKVAVKLLRSSVDEALDKRLGREAQAMAKLSHPNVVPVFDAGVHAGRAFVAMELVEGSTLREWLAVGQRSWQEVLAVFVQAGRGLAAAHAVGLVHRDFKPDNVLVGPDGRPRVADFGLSRLGHATETRAPPAELTSSSTLTATGALLGTPAYMAPEQLRAEDATAASDQFAFCVALWEGWCGRRPFRGDDPAGLLAAIERGPGELPGRVPAQLRRAVVRGLSPKPAERFASMPDLLAALSTRRRPWRLATLVALGFVAMAAVALVGFRERRSAACAGEERLLAGVWDDAKRERLKAAVLAGVGRSVLWDGAQKDLDGWARAWVRERHAACEATRVRREQTQPALQARTACLDQQRIETGALIDMLVTANGPALDRIPHLVPTAATVRACADALLLEQQPPQTFAERARFDAALHELATAKAMRDAGRYKEALDAALRIAHVAGSLGHNGLDAKALNVVGELYSLLGNTGTSRTRYTDAVESALAGADDETLIRAATALARLDVTDERLDGARTWVALAEGTAERIGKRDDLVALVEIQRGAVAAFAGDHETAAKHGERAMARLERLYGPDDLRIGAALDSLGATYTQLGRFDEARAMLDRALRIRETKLGNGHRELIQTLSALGALEMARDRDDLALRYFQRSLAIAEITYEPGHREIVQALTNLAAVERDLGKLDDALEHELRAFDERRKVVVLRPEGVDIVGYARSFSTIGGILYTQRRFDLALIYFREGFLWREEIHGRLSSDLLVPLHDLGETLRALGKLDEAIAYFERAKTIAERELPSEHEHRKQADADLARARAARK